MLLAEARAISSGHYERHDPAGDEAELVQLAGWCEQFSPLVGIEPPDNLILDVSGLAPLFGGEESLLRQLSRAIRRQGLLARIALADTVGAAWAVAHSCQQSPSLVPSGKTAGALAALPVNALRLPVETVGILAELGVERIGQLHELDRKTLAARFAPELIRRLDEAFGAVPELVVPRRPPPEITETIQLEYSVEDRWRIELLLAELTERICRTLAARQRGALQIEVQFECESDLPVSMFIGLFRASAEKNHLQELARLQLEQLSLPSPTTAIRLSVLRSAPLETWQQELFESCPQGDERTIGLLIDRLSSRLGRSAVLRPTLQPEAQPELAVRYEPLASAARRKRKARPNAQLPRPSQLWRRPISVNVVAAAPAGPPVRFMFRGTHQVTQCWGPERIQTGWWRGRYVERDYYRVETSAGLRFWMFRRLPDGQWFLHGAFD